MLKKMFIVSLSVLTINYTLYAAESRYPLHEAVKNGDSASVKELLKHRDVNEKDIYGRTPLHWAAFWGHHTVAQLLLNFHASVDAKAYGGWTPLHLAADNGHHDVAQLLLEAHATVDVKSNAGETPLYFAALHGHHDVEYLIMHWSDFKRGLCASLCKSILASCHPRCGAHSSVAIVPQHPMSMIIGKLLPGQCIYSPEEIQMYVQLWQALQQQNNGWCIVC